MQGSIVAKRVWPPLLFVAACAAYFYGLGDAPLLGADEPRYAQVAREMYERGDLVTPTLAGLTWFEKPALLYWLLAAAYGLFGVSEFAARVGSACCGMFCVLVVWLLGRRVEKLADGAKGLGLACAASLASSAGLLVFSRGANFDIVLTATLTAALASFIASELEEEGRRRKLLLAGFYAGVGLSLLAKGLVGIVLPFGIVALYLLLRRKWPGLVRYGVVWGLPLALAVASVWYAPAIARHGWAFIDEFFIQHHFARYFSNKYHHPQPFYFYLPIMALLLLPWTPFLADALWALRGRRLRIETAEEKLRAFATAWLAVPLLFFSLSGSKLPGYVLPALPGAALLAAGRLLRYVRGESGVGWMRASGGVALALGAAGLAYAFRGRVLPVSVALVVASPAFIAGAVALSLAKRRLLCAATLVGASFLTVILIAGLALGPYARRESVRDLLLHADAEGYSSWRVYYMLTNERTGEFYAAGRLGYDAEGETIKLDGQGNVEELLKQRDGRALIIVQTMFLPRLVNHPPLETKVLGENGQVALVAVSLR